MDDCIFCKVISGEIKKDFDYESENLVVFADINPAADTHLLIVPKQHIGGVSGLAAEHGALLAEIYSVVNKLVAEKGLENDLYRIVVNGGKAQHVPHLHFHLLGGEWKKRI